MDAGQVPALESVRERPLICRTAVPCYTAGPSLSLGTLASELESTLPSEDMRPPSTRAMTLWRPCWGAQLWYSVLA